MRILEEFWYGNIEPTEYDTSSCKEYKKLLELICRNEEKLQATMTDEQKDLFEKYADCVQEYQTITDCLIFQNSFKLGARMMLEVMEGYTIQFSSLAGKHEHLWQDVLRLKITICFLNFIRSTKSQYKKFQETNNIILIF